MILSRRLTNVQQLYIIMEPRATNVQPVGTCKLAYAHRRLLFLVGYSEETISAIAQKTRDTELSPSFILQTAG